MKSFLHKPSIYFPEHATTQEEMISFLGSQCSDEDFHSALEMLRNSEIEKRHFILPLPQMYEMGMTSGLADRAKVYQEYALVHAKNVTRQALEQSGVGAGDIDMIITVSCTNFIMPSLDVYVMNQMGFSPTVKRMPIAQLGCSAGVAAIAKAQDYLAAYPNHKVLILAVELSSLCFHPEKRDRSSVVCSGIFGDAMGACLVTGAESGIGSSIELQKNMAYTLPNSEGYIRYEITDKGYHLTLDRGVMHAVPKVAPLIEKFLLSQGCSSKDLRFAMAHTGGRRIIDLFERSLDLDADLLKHTRSSLKEYGNTVSLSVFDVLRRMLEDPRDGEAKGSGLISSFGPGFSMDLVSFLRLDPIGKILQKIEFLEVICLAVRAPVVRNCLTRGIRSKRIAQPSVPAYKPDNETNGAKMLKNLMVFSVLVFSQLSFANDIDYYQTVCGWGDEQEQEVTDPRCYQEEIVNPQRCTDDWDCHPGYDCIGNPGTGICMPDVLGDE